MRAACMAAALAGIIVAPAGMAAAQPAAPGNAYATIGQLEAQGYNVVIDRVGSAPIAVLQGCESLIRSWPLSAKTGAH